MKLLKKKEFYSLSALKTISFAVVNNPQGCKYFLDNQGLKYIFPIFAGKALKSKDPEIQKDTTKRAISMIFNLVLYLPDQQKLRILGKFVEKNCKNFLTLLNFRAKFMDELDEIEESRDIIIEALKLDKADEEGIEAEMTNRKMESCLMELYYSDFLLAWLGSQNENVRHFFEVDI
jgi:hypothetical protein